MASRSRSDAHVRVGVIGTGWWSTFAHIPSLRAHPHAEIVGVADADADRARAVAAENGIPHAFADHRELLALGLQAVVVATPHDTHHELARDALAAGADVLVEKPMVLEPGHARELVALARERGRNLHVGYPFPYTRHCRTLRERIARGDLGRITFATALFATEVLPLYRGEVESVGAPIAPGERTYSERARGGGQMYTQVTHSASTLLHLSGLVPETVVCLLGGRDADVDVWESVGFRTADGAVAAIASTGDIVAQERRVEEYRVFGSEGHALLDTAAGTLRLVDADGGLHEEPPLAPEEIYPAHATARRLVDAALGREPVLVPGDLGLLTVELLAAAFESARTGAAVRLGAPDRQR